MGQDGSNETKQNKIGILNPETVVKFLEDPTCSSDDCHICMG